ncbi:MAG: hypothetical protein IBX57_04695 [Gammaproteobacteria bacterium]|nr:hypothetical protein [Gammaproteobacteria bacterium]
MTLNLIRSILFCFILLSPYLSHAQDNWYDYDHLYIQGGTYIHYSSSPDHDGPNILASVEAVKDSNWLTGLALFDNSFGQFSQYLYVGKQWDYHGSLDGFHTKLTAGFIHGYRDQYKDKIAFNSHGIAPAIIPSIGYKKGRYGADVILLGLAGLVFTVGFDL